MDDKLLIELWRVIVDIQIARGYSKEHAETTANLYTYAIKRGLVEPTSVIAKMFDEGFKYLRVK